MKKTAIVLCLCLALCASFICFSAPAGAASSRVNVATGFSLGHPVMRRVLTPWAEEVRRRTGGRVDMRFYNPGALTPEREHFMAVRKGDIGAGHGLISANQGRLLITGIMDLPSVMTNSLAATEGFWRLYSASPEMQAEFAGIRVLAMHASSPYQINLVNGHIRSSLDFKNQKILTAPGGDSARLLRALGLNPLMTPAQDFALSLSRGMADGCLLPMSQLRAARLQESVTSISVCGLRMDCYWLGINAELYNSLPLDAQRALNDLSGLELSISIARVLNDLNNLARSELAKENITLNDIPAPERERWVENAGRTLQENWLAQLKRRDISGGLEIWSRAQGIFREAQTKWGHRAGQQISPVN